MGTSPTNPDTDGDGVGDKLDNAPLHPNPGQEDADGDGVGDVADAFPDDPLESSDDDGDGFGDNADICPATTFPDVAEGTLRSNRWRFDENAQAFVQGSTKGKGGGAGRGGNTTYTMAETGGCSCAQIIEGLDLGKGHVKYGSSNSAMEEWAARVANGDVTVPVSGKTSFDFAISEINEMDPYLSEVPTEVTLEGNYPNPFNPQTTIRFGLPETAEVSLVVYDMMGREVKVLVNGTLNAGMHEASFDASSLPSGAYMYRLTTPGQEFSKLMMLLK